MIKKEEVIVGTKQEIQEYLDNELCIKPYNGNLLPGVNYGLSTDQPLNEGFMHYFYLKGGDMVSEILDNVAVPIVNYSIVRIFLYIKKEVSFINELLNKKL